MSRIIIDVREPDEFAAGHAEGAINIPLSEMMNQTPRLNDIPKDAELVVYCNSGNRSGVAKTLLEAKGYSRVVNGINQQQLARRHHG